MFLLLQTQTIMLDKRPMNLKTAIYILGVTLLSTFASCLGDKDDNTEVVYSTDAQITSFSIKGHIVLPGNDTIKNGLNAIGFSIDQIEGKIFNRDSAIYRLILPEKVAVTFSTASGANLLNITDKDSVWIKSGDSIDIRKPVQLRSFARNGDTKEYTFTFNIHQIDPDSIWWQLVNRNLGFLGQEETKTVIFNDVFYCFEKNGIYGNKIFLHISLDKGVTWKIIPATVLKSMAFPLDLPVDAVLSQMQHFGEELFVCTAAGELYKANISNNFTSWEKVNAKHVKNIFGTVAKENVLALAVEKDGIIVSATFDGKNWKYGDKLPELLPKQDFSSLSYTRANAGHLTIAGGISGTTWGTTDGLSWTKIGDLPSNMVGSNVFIYDDKFYLLNGMTDTFNKSVYTSKDGGITWQLSPTKTNLPKGYTFGTGASVVVDSENIIYIIGGNKGDTQVTDIWRGRLNRLNR